MKTYTITVYPSDRLHPGGRDRWFWRIKAKNGRIIADGSEGYRTKASALSACRRLMFAKLVLEAQK